MHIGAKVADIGRKGRQPCPRGPSHAFRRKDRRVIQELRFFPGAVCQRRGVSGCLLVSFALGVYRAECLAV